MLFVRSIPNLPFPLAPFEGFLSSLSCDKNSRDEKSKQNFA